jgi:hypothetical protein
MPHADDAVANKVCALVSGVPRCETMLTWMRSCQRAAIQAELLRLAADHDTRF